MFIQSRCSRMIHAERHNIMRMPYTSGVLFAEIALQIE